MIYIILLIILFILLIWYYNKFKRIKLPNVFLCSGAVKTGKSALSVYLAIRTYRKNVFVWKLQTIICSYLKFLRVKKFRDYEKPLKPMLYSNIKLLNVRHNIFTIDILMRKVRIPNKSVVLLDEVALIADSMLYKNREINAHLTLFVKLFGHYSHGGTLILNTQSIQDCHYAFKRCINSYVYIHSKIRFPFVTLFKLQELYYSEDGSNINANINGDIEKSMLLLLIRGKYFKMYDCYCYSIFTDNLTYEVDYDKVILKSKKDLKVDELVTLQEWEGLLKKESEVVL